MVEAEEVQGAVDGEQAELVGEGDGAGAGAARGDGHGR